MTKIESRPSKRKAWEYFFFVDCDGHMEDRRVAKAISLLSEHCSYVKVLGSYPDLEYAGSFHVETRRASRQSGR